MLKLLNNVVTSLSSPMTTQDHSSSDNSSDDSDNEEVTFLAQQSQPSKNLRKRKKEQLPLDHCDDSSERSSGGASNFSDDQQLSDDDLNTFADALGDASGSEEDEAEAFVDNEHSIDDAFDVLMNCLNARKVPLETFTSDFVSMVCKMQSDHKHEVLKPGNTAAATIR